MQLIFCASTMAQTKIIYLAFIYKFRVFGSTDTSQYSRQDCTHSTVAVSCKLREVYSSYKSLSGIFPHVFNE